MMLLLACTAQAPDSGAGTPPTDDSEATDSPADSQDSQDSDPPEWGRLPGELVVSESPALDRSATLGNPFVGFLPSYLWSSPENDLEHSMEYVPVSMKELNDGEGSFTFETGLEPLLLESEARGKHAVVRIWIDTPALETGLPDWLAEQVTMTPYEDHGGGEAPDWDDPILQDALVDLVEAFGQAYDGDPRIATVQLGLIGFWGEWHTWPHDWMPDEAFQERFVTAWAESFPTTPLMIRLPYANAVEQGLGFHDDSFAYSTVGDTSWFFVPLLEDAGADEQWRVAPVGGELRPELQETIFTDAYETGEYAQDFSECVEATHASWLLNSTAFRAEELDPVREAAVELGYAYALDSVELTVGGYSEGLVDVSAKLQWQNHGVAPDYHDLLITLDWGQEQASWPATVVPGELRQGQVDFGRVPLEDLEQPFVVGLDSAWLLGDQQARLAHASTVELRVEPGCDGASVGEVVEGCICDVDGVFRDRDGDHC